MYRPPNNHAEITVSQAKAIDAPLARLLAPLAGDTPLSARALRAHARPGQPIDRLAVCAIIFEYLRFSGR
ncbi:hypothetical protein Deba_1002 [Desulfarculus baarsii DSM 2075]|uniref:Uncharacterized protein n=1 Tax=Desulfarculus baarsii (strain ATCC 33931 / DSM 2075 / LMG 7858 / VKM B-1802 / 2st14) TaxID=644282 RepID=E1QFN6_DESB2|nr:hypothetical protein [Desulfarculus baarsii]ADK84372.1 hypothetical protein Deba_1002 [Desulfarculus baarsii DSM 2075]